MQKLTNMMLLLIFLRTNRHLPWPVKAAVAFMTRQITAEPALGASLQLDSPDDRDLLKNLYGALGRSGSAPILPPTPDEGMGSKRYWCVEK